MQIFVDIALKSHKFTNILLIPNHRNTIMPPIVIVVSDSLRQIIALDLVFEVANNASEQPDQIRTHL